MISKLALILTCLVQILPLKSLGENLSEFLNVVVNKVEHILDTQTIYNLEGGTNAYNDKLIFHPPNIEDHLSHPKLENFNDVKNIKFQQTCEGKFVRCEYAIKITAFSEKSQCCRKRIVKTFPISYFKNVPQNQGDNLERLLELEREFNEEKVVKRVDPNAMPVKSGDDRMEEKDHD